MTFGARRQHQPSGPYFVPVPSVSYVAPAQVDEYVAPAPIEEEARTSCAPRSSFAGLGVPCTGRVLRGFSASRCVHVACAIKVRSKNTCR